MHAHLHIIAMADNQMKNISKEYINFKSEFRQCLIDHQNIIPDNEVP